MGKYDEMLEKYLSEGINWDAYNNEVIKTANKSEAAKGDVEQFAADSYWQGWQDANSENGKLNMPVVSNNEVAVCDCDEMTWNNDIGSFVCDKCNKKH